MFTLSIISLSIFVVAAAASEEASTGGGSLRRLLEDAQTPEVVWQQGYKPGGPAPGYTFSVDTDGTGDFEERLRIRNDGQWHMTTSASGGPPPAIKMGSTQQGWQIIAAANEFRIFDIGNAVPFRIANDAPLNTLKVNRDGSISVATAIVNGINITALDERVARFESVITIQDDGTTTMGQGASVIGCFDVVGSCPAPNRRRGRGRGRRGLKNDANAMMEFHQLYTRVRNLEAMVDGLNVKLKSMQSKN